jgi:hypothetical protein
MSARQRPVEITQGKRKKKKKILPNRVNCNLLLPHKRVERVLYKCPTNRTGSLLQNAVQRLDMMATPNPDELENWFVIFQCQIRLVTCILLIYGHDSDGKVQFAYYRET